MAVLKCLCDQIGYVRIGNVVHCNVCHALITDLRCKLLCSCLGIAIHGRIHDHDTLLLRLVSAPLVMLIKIISEIFTPNRTVQRAEHLNWNASCLL